MAFIIYTFVNSIKDPDGKQKAVTLVVEDAESKR
jgi:hypothetical protein